MRGQAMVEMVIVSAFVLVPLFLAIPVLGKYLDMRAAAVQSARYAAWERTVWFGGASATAMGWGSHQNNWQANEKTDDQIRRELGVRLLSKTTDAFSSTDRSASDFNNGIPEMWHDRTGGALLASYDDIGNAVGNATAPGTMDKVLQPIVDLAATLGPFVLEMGGEYAANVTVNVKDFDRSNFQPLGTTMAFKETNVLLGNGWSAGGPDDTTKTAVKQQVQGLLPTSIFDGNKKKTVKYITETIQKIGSVFAPELSPRKLEFGKIEQDLVPPDRLKQ